MDQGTSGTILCPRDGEILAKTTSNGFVVFRCPECKGVWLPPELVRPAVGELDDSARGNPTELCCPGCRASLFELLYQEVHIDHCPTCGGLWLDRGELEQLLEIRNFPGKQRKRSKQGHTVTEVFVDIVIHILSGF